MSDAPEPTSLGEPPPADRREPWLVLGLAAVFLVLQAPWLGIWEPWEADVATVIDAMRAGDWLRVVAADGRAVAELPYGYWPSAALAALAGTGELALRLPTLLLALPTVLLTFLVTRRIYGRSAAWFAALALLCMPLFVFHGRLALGAGIAMNCSALAALGFLRLGAGPARAGWAWLAWGGLAAAMLTGGAPAAAGPLAALVALGLGAARSGERVARPAADAATRLGFLAVAVAVGGLLAAGEAAWAAWAGLAGAGTLVVAFGLGSDVATLARQGWLRRVCAPLPAVVALAIMGVGIWQATSALEAGSLRSLLLWADGLDGPARAAERPPFNTFVHQIGYGLFPLGAFVPLAFAELLWHPRREDEPGNPGLAATAVAAWFALGFLGPALGAPIGQAAFFLAAPAVAIAGGVWLGRALRSPPQPLHALAAVLLLALLDSNLKHQTQALADTLVGSSVDAFPPTLPGWWVTRLLDFGLLGLILLYQGGLLRFIRPVVLAVVYPTRRLHWFNPLVLLVAAAVAGVVIGIPREAMERLVMAQNLWGRLVVDARWAVVFGALWAVAVVVLHLVHALRVKRLAGARSGLLLAAADRLEATLRRPQTPWMAVGGVLLLWGGFLNLGLAATLTTHFSQKDLIVRYEELARGPEPLFKYLVAERGSSFYAERLEALDAPGFKARATSAERFFAIVPRKELARVNNEFRGVANRTVPVLDDRSHRFLLVSNQLADGEEDRNPINRALLTELPPEATPANINFEDQIELVGWALDPPVPRPGAELTFKLYWKAKKRIAGRWKVFVHLDAPGQRIHGDHDPVEGLFPTDNWKPGDLVQDEHRVVVKRTTAAARFTLYVGLYRGDTRMKIVAGDKDNENRARLGGVNVR